MAKNTHGPTHNWDVFLREYLTQSDKDCEPVVEKWFKKNHPTISINTIKKATTGWHDKYAQLQESINEKARIKMIERSSDLIAKNKEQQLSFGKMLLSWAQAEAVQKKVKKDKDGNPVLGPDKKPVYELDADGKPVMEFKLEAKDMSELTKVVEAGVKLINLATGEATDRPEVMVAGTMTLQMLQERALNAGSFKKATKSRGH